MSVKLTVSLSDSLIIVRSEPQKKKKKKSTVNISRMSILTFIIYYGYTRKCYTCWGKYFVVDNPGNSYYE